MNVIGIDVGGTTIKAVVADETGTIAAQWNAPTPKGGDGVADAVADLVTRIESEHDVARSVTVAVPGIVDDDAGMAILSVNLGWENYPMRSEIASRLDRPIGLAHDVRSGALAEAKWGADLPSCIYIAMGTGLASAVIIDHAPFVPSPWLGEIGQIPTTTPEGEPVTLERMCSANAFADRMRFLGGDIPDTAGAYEVFQAHWAGDPIASRAIDECLDYLADAISPMVYTLGPLPLIIGGGMAKEGPRLLDLIHSHLEPHFGLVPVPELHLAQLGSWSQALGAAAASLAMEGA